MDEAEYMRLAPHDKYLVMTEALRQLASLERARGRPLANPDREQHSAELRRQFATDPEVLLFLRHADARASFGCRRERWGSFP
jgi:hypothetical protein